MRQGVGRCSLSRQSDCSHENNPCKTHRNSFANQLRAAEKELLEIRDEMAALQSEIALRKRLLRRAHDAELATREREMRMSQRNIQHLNQELDAAQARADAATSKSERGDARAYREAEGEE